MTDAVEEEAGLMFCSVCPERVPVNEHPEMVVIRDSSLPNMSGKVTKRILRENVVSDTGGDGEGGQL